MADSTGVELGVVVVGVGIAGKVRIRDLTTFKQDGNLQWKLIGFVSRRAIEIDGIPQLTEEEALTRADVNAVIICTEPGSHERLVRNALQNNKHVLVEYPMATSARATKELFEVAANKGLILHEENISLLTPAFATLQEGFETARSPLVRGEIKLVGGYKDWVFNMEESGGPFNIGIFMVQSLYQLVGDDLEVTGGHLERDDQGFTATAMLTSSKCRNLKLTIQRSKETVKREKTYLFELEDGTILNDKPTTTSSQGDSQQKIGLFMQDYLLFVEKLNGLRDSSKDTARVIRCMQLADQIHKLMGLIS